MLKKSLLVLSAAAVMAACSPATEDTTPDEAMMDNDQAMMQDDTSMMNDQNSDSMDSEMMGSEDGVMVGGAQMVPTKDIVDNAVNSSDHTTLVAAVQAAGLAETLKGNGPFTVFAPTNSAFDKLPSGTVDELMMPENKEQLTSVLTYHVVPGNYTSADLEDGMSLTTVQGEELTVSMRNGNWYVNDAMITIPDVISSNGVTYVIDSVIMPPSMR